jgi:hypothetical protein
LGSDCAGGAAFLLGGGGAGLAVAPGAGRVVADGGAFAFVFGNELAVGPERGCVGVGVTEGLDVAAAGRCFGLGGGVSAGRVATGGANEELGARRGLAGVVSWLGRTALVFAVAGRV